MKMAGEWKRNSVELSGWRGGGGGGGGGGGMEADELVVIRC